MIRFQRSRLNLAAATVGATLSLAGGAVIAAGGLQVVGLLAAGLAAFAVGWLLLWRVLMDPRFAIYVVGAGAVGLMAINGLRVNANTTYSDLLLVAVATLIVLLALVGGHIPRLPLWLVIGGGLILASAVIVQLYPPRRLPPDILNATFFVSAVTGTSSPVEPNLVLASRLLIALVVAPIVVGLLPTTWRQCRVLISFWLGGVAISSAVGVLAVLTPLDLQNSLTGIPPTFGDRAIGLTVHPVSLGLTAAFAFPVAFSRMISAGHTLRYAPLTVLFLLAVVVSGSRAPLAECGLALILVAAAQSRSRRQILTAVMIAAPPLIVLWPKISQLAVFQRLLGASGQNSNAQHLSAVTSGLQAFADRPIGSGFQAIRTAHDVPIQLLESGGPLALLGYGIVIIGAIRLGFWVYGRAPASLKSEVTGLLASMGVLLGEALVGNSSFDRYLYLPIGLLLGMSFVAQRQPPAVDEALNGGGTKPNLMLEQDLASLRSVTAQHR